ncbi:MAG TPA: hypothetical protein PKO06_10040, partial [Candidatus Ozemobacteraceae bacterium]|nr:hypothetical protein [Candidatus Ozemobacteraceae bacterium]
LDKFESAPIWPYVLMVVALALVLLITRQFDKARTIEPPTWIERPAAEAADDRLPAEAPDPGPLVPTLATPPIPAPLLALSPSSSVIDEAELYNLRVLGLEPTFSSTFGESAMAPWQSSLDS